MITQIFFILLAVALIAYIYAGVRKNQLSQDESIFWMLGCLVVLLLGIWPNIIVFLAKLIGIDYPPSLLFLMISIFIIFLAYRNSRHISILNEKNKELIQIVALMEKRIRELEK